ncbi:MAG TPA: hypothetical protein VKK79_16570 [Candidatus Lokiarchaeia archaeon]|nr:hypothetical protein [Candidatus Lokiarchaeia archaeon]
MTEVNLAEMLAGTANILAFYIILFGGTILILIAVRPVDKIFVRLNRVHVTREQRLFVLNYIMIAGLIAVIVTTVVLAALKEFRGDYWFFMAFSFFSFFLGAIALGWLAPYVHFVKVGDYHVGNGILLLLGSALFGMCGVNLHDVLWCGTATDWFQNKVIGGYDLQGYFTFFQIADPTRWDYRVMGFYMIFQATIEVNAALLLFHKYFKIAETQAVATPRRRELFTYVLCLAASTLLGLVEFVFDSPWLFTDVQYYATLYIGIAAVACLFAIAGYSAIP